MSATHDPSRDTRQNTLVELLRVASGNPEASQAALNLAYVIASERPGDLDALTHLMRAYHACGMVHETAEVGRVLIEQRGTVTAIALMAGNAILRTGDADTALTVAANALVRAPGHPGLEKLRAEAYAAGGWIAETDEEMSRPEIGVEEGVYPMSLGEQVAAARARLVVEHNRAARGVAPAAKKPGLFVRR